MNSSTPQGHMIDQVCKGLNAYIHYMGNCSGTHSFDSPGGRNWVLDEMKAYMDKKGHVIGKNRHRSIHAIDILEIYCSEDSQITKQGDRQNMKTMRFGLKQGDLATYEGRCKLYDCLLKGMPRDAWMSPSCKAWCRWNQFNAARSPEMAKRVMHARERDEVHLMLCSAVFWYQVQMGKHFHLEQPKGSHMIFQEALAPIVQHTWHATCDQCTAGQLKNPETQRYLKKGMQFFTTSRIVAETINQHQCKREHPHDPVAGTFRSRDGRRQSVAQFTELYTAVFASRVCRALLASNKVAEQLCVHQPFLEQDINTNDVEEDTAVENPEPDNKRRRLLLKQSPPSGYEEDTKAEAQNPSEAGGQSATSESSMTEPEPKADSNPWEEILKEAMTIAPRVGTKVIEQGEFLDRIQKECTNHQVRVVELCKGADRCRKPPIRLAKGEAPFRLTLGLHRQAGQIFSHDWTHWESKSVRQMITKTQPARLLVTVFGRSITELDNQITDKKESSKRESQAVVEEDQPPKRVRINENPKEEEEEQDQTDTPGKRAGEVANSQNPEAKSSSEESKIYHGEKFRKLTPEERQWIKKIHVNLGHPNKEKLKNLLNIQNCSKHLIDAIDDFQCSTCAELQLPRTARPAVMHEEKDFNDCIGCDLVTWTTQTGERHQFLHVIDFATNFQLAKPVYQTDHVSMEEALQNTWFHWAGIPKMMILDGESALCSEKFQQYCTEKSIHTKVVAAYAHWQMGKVERHGDILQSMLTHIDKDKSISAGKDFEEALQQCCNAKNMLSRVKGYTPEILVLGKSSRLPGSLTNEPFDACNQALETSTGETPEAVAFRQSMQRREEARKAFIASDNSATLRRAFLRRSRPNRGQHAAGTHVMFWRAGKWQGPGRVIIQEGQSVVWISHFGRVYRMAPEHVRNLSERETNNHWTSISQAGPLELGNQQGQGVFRYEDLTQQAIPAGQGMRAHELETEIPIPTPEPNPVTESLGGSQPDAEPEYVPTTPSSQQEPIGADTANVPAADIPVPEDTELLCEDYWITKGDRIIRVHNVPRQTSFNPSQASDCPINPLLLMDDRITKGKEINGGIWENKDAWPVNNDPWKKDTPWVGLSIFFVNTEEESSETLSQEQDAFTLDEEECWECEIHLTLEEIQQLIQPETAVDVFLATTAKKQRAEVKLSTLSQEQKQQFEQAKNKEIDQWLDTETVRRILRSKIPMENIMRCRWILTWKDLDPNDLKPGDSRHKPKARLVVLGYEDPNIEEIPRDSPTLQRESRSVLLQIGASQKWNIEAFDIKTAFLRGSRRDDRLLGIEPPEEMRNRMGLRTNEICELRKSAYGLVNAPYLWYQELKEALLGLNFVMSPMDPCLFVLPGPNNSIHGILGIHVDDGIGCGDYKYQQTIKIH